MEIIAILMDAYRKNAYISITLQSSETTVLVTLDQIDRRQIIAVYDGTIHDPGALGAVSNLLDNLQVCINARPVVAVSCDIIRRRLGTLSVQHPSSRLSR